MNNDYTAEVIRYFRRKSINGFDEPISYLGAEQRFVGALRNSGINNLEEQYLLGTDTYTEIYVDADGTTIIEKSFHINDSVHRQGNYYKIKSWIYGDGGLTNEDYYFEGNALRLPYNTDEVVFGDGGSDYPNEEGLYMLDPQIYMLEGENAKIFPSSFTTLRKDELHYIKDDGSDLLVLTKLTGRKYIEDGMQSREAVKESITNHLLDS